MTFVLAKRFVDHKQRRFITVPIQNLKRKDTSLMTSNGIRSSNGNFPSGGGQGRMTTLSLEILKKLDIEHLETLQVHQKFFYV